MFNSMRTQNLSPGARKEEESVFAFSPMSDPLEFGDTGVNLEDIRVFVSAIWPHELDVAIKTTEAETAGDQ